MSNPNLIHISINGGTNKGKTIVAMLINEALEAHGIKPIVLNRDGDLIKKIEHFKSNPEKLISDYIYKIFTDMDTKVVIEDNNRRAVITDNGDVRNESIYIPADQFAG